MLALGLAKLDALSLTLLESPLMGRVHRIDVVAIVLQTLLIGTALMGRVTRNLSLAEEFLETEVGIWVDVPLSAVVCHGLSFLFGD